MRNPSVVLWRVAGAVALAACADQANGPSGGEAMFARAPRISINVTLGADTLLTGSSTQAVATLRDRRGNDISGRTVSWSSADTSVAVVSGSGTVSARRPGRTFIRASAAGVSDQMVLTVIAAPVDSTPSDSLPTDGLPTDSLPKDSLPADRPWYEQNWDYASTSIMKASLWSLTENNGAFVALQESGVEGGRSSVNKALRATYSTTIASSAKAAIRPPDWNLAKPREVWVETWIRFDAAWVTRSDDKTFFYLEDHSAGGGPLETNRWETHIVAPTLWYGGPSGGVIAGTIPDFFKNNTLRLNAWDGVWHRMRHHLKMSSTPSSPDGAYKVWWDDTVIIDRANFGSGSPTYAYFHSITLGANADPAGSGIRDWGRVRVYLTNPGW